MQILSCKRFHFDIEEAFGPNESKNGDLALYWVSAGTQQFDPERMPEPNIFSASNS